ncbi:VIT1/CCC1 transporter family protein [Streptosporangium album]|uniref:VIT1/CCC1 transporter family protein n=1 Tax=Streptosporangium album TaxID=47479 RepID=UPI0035E3FA27
MCLNLSRGAEELREELGLDPEELCSPWSAAVSSLIAFALGAVVVVLPHLFGSGTTALVTAVVLAAVALFTVGSALGLLNGRPPLRSGARQLLVGGGAALVVYPIGHAVGTGGGRPGQLAGPQGEGCVPTTRSSLTRRCRYQRQAAGERRRSRSAAGVMGIGSSP